MDLRKMFSNFGISKEQENYSELSKKERFEKIFSKKISKEVYEYLKSHFDNLEIEILGDYKGNLMDLMKRGVLEGWRWETTETAILFMDDKSYIERGNLKFERNNNYYHSWITFNYKGQDYVFNPCLQILCRKEVYSKCFEVEVKGKTTAKQVREFFLNYISNPPKKEYSADSERFRKKFFGEQALERTRDEIVVHDKEDPSAPMYRNGVGYKATIESGNVKKLVAHYYMNA